MATNTIVRATNATAPKGCGSKVDSLYYNLCDSGAVWGIAVEAAAGAGVVFCFVLFVMLLANLPLTKNHDQKSSAVLHAAFLLCTAGLFGLAFAFIVGKDFSTCTARRFLFGVLFAGCFSCLLVQAVRLNVLVRRSDDSAAPRIWPFCLAALALWLVEVVINVEWLIITVVRHPQGPPNATADARASATPCNVANQDFVMALIYVMALMLAALAASLAVLAGRSSRWKKEGGLILLASLLSVGVWVAWIVMYVYGNERAGGPAWDDPTLAIALAANAWLFLVSYIIPNVCCLSGGGAEDQLAYEQNLYAGRGVGYETILKQQSQTNLYVENKAFSMDEPNQGSKPVSPYSGYTGQLRSSVYQPTELALISKAVGNQHQPERSYDMIIPRASTGSAGPPGGPGTGTGEAGNSAQTHGHGLQRTPQW